MTRSLRRSLAAVTTLALALGGVLVSAVPASAAASVSITVSDRPELSGVADSTYLTEVAVSGSGFQSVHNGFGGIYVLFGWVDGGAWQPSQGGTTGSSYRYVYDDETNPVGYQLFASFPGSSTSYANNGGYVNADGTWNATMKIPGPKFQAYDRAGAVTEVDCTQVQCGIITVGAHGVVNAANESFTPISFREIYTAADGRQVAQAGGAGAPAAAVAPTVIGGRPATIPPAIASTALSEASRAGVEAEVGETRLAVTVPGSDPHAWLGIYLTPEIFAGWFKPSSTGLIDVDVPGNLPEGKSQAVVVNTDGALTGWADFEFELASDTEAVATNDSPDAVATAAAPAENPTLLIVAIAVGVVAIAALAFLGWTIVRGRRARTAAPSTTND